MLSKVSKKRKKVLVFEWPSKKLSHTHSFRERRKNYWRSLETSRPETDDEAVVDAVDAEES